MEFPPHKPGVYKQTLESREQRYALYIPDSYASGRSHPLVLVLHWGGPMYPFKGMATLEKVVLPAFRELDALMVAPDCTAGHWANPQSEAAVLELLDHLLDHDRVDRDRILLTGISRGGIGTWFIAGRNQERFAGALPVAATPPAEALEIKWNLPLFVIHSQQDERFPFAETEAVVHKLRAKGASIELVALESITHYETQRLVEPLRQALPWVRSIWGMM